MTHWINTGRHGILVPKFTDVVVDSGIKVGVSGHFKLRASCPGRYKGFRELAEFDNIIFNQGLAKAVAAPIVNVWDGVQVSTSSTVPVATDTTLGGTTVNFLTEGLSNSTGYVSGGTPYEYVVSNYRSLPGVATGTWAKVGMRSSVTPNMFNGALILDGVGSPTTVTVLADEYLDILYELRVYWPTADTTGSTTISGSSYAWVLRTSRLGYDPGYSVGLFASVGIFTLNNYNQAYPATSTLGTITSIPSGGGSAAFDYPVVSTGTAARRFTSTLPLTSNPAGGVGAVNIPGFISPGGNPCVGFQQSFSPAIPKTSSTVLTLVHDISTARVP